MKSSGVGGAMSICGRPVRLVHETPLEKKRGGVMTMNAIPPRESLDAMLRIESRGPGQYAASLESFWGGTACGDLLARMALAVMAEGGSAPTSLHASFLGRLAPGEVAIQCEPARGVQRRVRALQSDADVC